MVDDGWLSDMQDELFRAADDAAAVPWAAVRLDEKERSGNAKLSSGEEMSMTDLPEDIRALLDPYVERLQTKSPVEGLALHVMCYQKYYYKVVRNKRQIARSVDKDLMNYVAAATYFDSRLLRDDHAQRWLRWVVDTDDAAQQWIIPYELQTAVDDIPKPKSTLSRKGDPCAALVVPGAKISWRPKKRKASASGDGAGKRAALNALPPAPEDAATAWSALRDALYEATAGLDGDVPANELAPSSPYVVLDVMPLKHYRQLLLELDETGIPSLRAMLVLGAIQYRYESMQGMQLLALLEKAVKGNYNVDEVNEVALELRSTE